MFVRLSFLVVGLIFGLSKVGYGQRVYATAQQPSPKQTLLGGTLSEVINPLNSVDNIYTNSATLTTNVGLLALIESWQNLQFAVKPGNNSPVVIKFSASGGGLSVLNLLGGVQVQTTNGNVNAGTAYTGATLLNLLGLFSQNTPVEVLLPAPNVAYDGVRLYINTVLAVGLSAQYFYAFYIKPPTSNDLTVCTGFSALLSVTNVQPGYTYKWYEQETGGTALAAPTNGTFTTPVITAAKSYYVEALDGTYPSARKKVNITTYNKPTTPLVNLRN